MVHLENFLHVLSKVKRKNTFDDDDQNTNTKSENSKKNEKTKGNGKKQVIDEIPGHNIQTNSKRLRIVVI
jgi:hypothetical protein